MSPTQVRQALAGLPETHLTIFYGPTENTTFTSYCPLSEPAEVGLGAAGPPHRQHPVSVLDADGRLAPVGIAGELCAAGEGLARGYLNRPELTAERSFPTRRGGRRLYRTGDLARVLPDGRLDFLGRIDHPAQAGPARTGRNRPRLDPTRGARSWWWSMRPRKSSLPSGRTRARSPVR